MSVFVFYTTSSVASEVSYSSHGITWQDVNAPHMRTAHVIRVTHMRLLKRDVSKMQTEGASPRVSQPRCEEEVRWSSSSVFCATVLLNREFGAPGHCQKERPTCAWPRIITSPTEPPDSSPVTGTRSWRQVRQTDRVPLGPS